MRTLGFDGGAQRRRSSPRSGDDPKGEARSAE
jgi:hypothetical protein